MNPITTKLWTFVIVGCLTSGGILWFFTGEVLAETNYNLTGETVNKGYSVNPTYRNLEDAQYNQLIEGDQYANTNFSASSEDMTYGTAGGGAFPSSLDTDDDTRRTYTEENTATGPPASYELFLYPNGNVLDDWNIAVPGVDHYLNVDETTEGGDGATTYVEASSNDVVDRFAMADMSDPGAGYTLNVSVFAVHYKGASQPNSFQAGIRISTTDYEGFDVNPSNGDYTNDTSDPWLVNPATTSAWTYSEVNVLVAYITTDDASPNVRCTQVGLHIMVNFTAVETYQLDAEITFSSVGETGQTTGFYVFIQGHRIGTEDFDIYAYDYVAPGWNKKDTIDQASDADYNFALTANEYNATSDTILIRILDTVEDDDCQCIVYLDVLKVMRIELGYALDVELTSTAIPAYGNISVRIKGYTSAEAFQVDVYNYTATDWDTDELQISDLGNDWQTTIDLDDDDHRSGQTVLIRLVDTVSQTSDITQDTLFLDVIWISLYYTDPTITAYRAENVEIDEGQNVIVWCTYTDYDNQAPSYVRVHVDVSNYAMDANDSDTDYFDGKLYGYTITGLTDGVWDYWFAVKDAESGEVTTSPTYTITVTEVLVNNAPVIDSTPIETGDYDVFYSYDCNATDADPPDVLLYELTSNASFLSIHSSLGYVNGTPDETETKWYLVNITVSDQNTTVEEKFDWQEYQLTITYTPSNTAPYFTSTPDYTSHNNTLYYYDANADDDDEPPDTLTFDLEGNITDFATIAPSTGIVQGTPSVIGDYWMNISVTDGTATVWQNSSIHIYTDSPSFVTSAITTWQNGTTYQYNAQATDPESEALTFDLEGNGTGFVGITPAGYYCMLEGGITVMGWWYLNLSVSDGTNIVWQNFTLTALNSAPYFTTDPVLTGQINVSYAYHPNATDNNSDVLIYSIDASPSGTTDWLSFNVSTGAIEGTPTVVGEYDVNLSVTDTLGAITWQNFTITIDIGDGELNAILVLIIALCFCFGIMLAGFKERMLLIMAGFVWMFCGIAIFIDYGDAFMFMSVGIGAALLIKGAYDVWN